MVLENGEILAKEADMDRWGKLVKSMNKKGIVGYYEQKWLQEGEEKGMQQGMQQGMLKERQRIFAFLKSGHSLEEAEKKFAFA